MNNDLKRYLDEHIITLYSAFDLAHQKDHVLNVIKNSMEIALEYDVDLDMVYVIACFHDVGLKFGRSDHHLTGGTFLYQDGFIQSFFSEEQRKIMKEAVEDHRASSDHEPRSIYGKIIAEADRDISLETVIQRTIQYGLKHYPYLSKDEVIKRAYDHIQEKYGESGYLKLWLDTKKNQNGLRIIHQWLSREIEMKKMIENFYEKEKSVMK